MGDRMKMSRGLLKGKPALQGETLIPENSSKYPTQVGDCEYKKKFPQKGYFRPFVYFFCIFAFFLCPASLSDFVFLICENRVVSFHMRSRRS